MKRKIWFSALFFMVFTVFCTVACKTVGEGKAEVVFEAETRVVIQVRTTDGNATLVDVMTALQEEEKISFTITGGMLTELNGKANTADFSGCWMLYTSDTEMSTAEWGNVEYDGKTYGSAILGADALTVMEGCLYIWEYQSF